MWPKTATGVSQPSRLIFCDIVKTLVSFGDYLFT